MAIGLRSRMSIEHVVREVGADPGRLDPRAGSPARARLGGVDEQDRLAAQLVDDRSISAGIGVLVALHLDRRARRTAARRASATTPTTSSDDADGDRRPTSAAGGSRRGARRGAGRAAADRCSARPPGRQRCRGAGRSASMTIVDAARRRRSARRGSRAGAARRPRRGTARRGWSSSAITIVRRAVGAAAPTPARRGRSRHAGFGVSGSIGATVGFGASPRLAASAPPWPPAWTPWRRLARRLGRLVGLLRRRLHGLGVGSCRSLASRRCCPSASASGRRGRPPRRR